MARQLRLGRGLAALAAALTACSSVMVWSALSGMEVPLFTLLSLVGMTLHLRERRGGGGVPFSAVVLALALQAVNYPDRVLEEMLRIGREGIVTFPNFGHWRCRLHLAMKGRMPVSEHLPHSWFDTPNIHLCTFLDFERFCHDRRLDIIERFVVDAGHANRPLINRFPNFFGTIAFYRLGRPGS